MYQYVIPKDTTSALLYIFGHSILYANAIHLQRFARKTAYSERAQDKDIEKSLVPKK